MPLGEVRTGKAAILGNKKKGGGGKYMQFINWKNNETRSLFFLTPIDDVMRIMVHNYVRKVVETDDGGERDLWLTFMCRKDPAWLDESGGDCPLCDEIGHKAVEKIIALAVEVDPVMEGKRYKGVEIKYRQGIDREGKEQDYPLIGVVMQSSHNFFQYLYTQSQKRDISDITWEITREGEGLTTKYSFYPIEMTPNVDNILQFVPDLYDYVSDLGSIERYERELEGVKAEDQLTFGKKPTKSRSNAAKLGENSSTLFDEMKEAIEKNSRTRNIETY